MEINKIYLGDALILINNIPDNSIDMVFMDPPFGHNNNQGDLISRREAVLGTGDYVPERDDIPIMNDGKEADINFKKLLPEIHRVLKPGSVCCCCCSGGGGPSPLYAKWSLYLDEVFIFKQMIIWDKGPMGMGWHYRRSYETVLVSQKKGAACKWYDTSYKVENVIRHIHKIIPSSSHHPTEKPTALASHFIKLHSLPNDIILDPFCGSGSTLLAADKLNRQWIGFELDEKWFNHATEKLYNHKLQLKLFK